MKQDDKATDISADKNGSVSVQPNCVQTVSSAEYQHAIDRLSAQIRQMAKPMVETQEVIRKSLEPMVEVSRAISEMMENINKQMQPLTLSYRDFLLALSERGLAGGNTTLKITSDNTKKNTVTIEATKTTKKGDVERQQNKIVQAELVGEDKEILRSIQRTVEKKLSFEDVEKWLTENGMKAITIKVTSLIRQETNLTINGIKVTFEPFSRQDLFLKNFFNEETNKPDEETQEFGISARELYFAIDSPDDLNDPCNSKEDTQKFFQREQKKYQDLKDAINRKVQMATGLQNFIVFLSETKCWKINEQYLK